jgi:hypothetical protein
MFNALEPQEKGHTTANGPAIVERRSLSLVFSRATLYGTVCIEITNFGSEKNEKRRNPAA